MTTLLVAEHDNKLLKDATHRALTAAKELGGDVHVLVAGKDARCGRGGGGASSTASRRCFWQMALPTSTCSRKPLAALVASLAPSYDAIVAAATTTGKNFMPRVAALLDVMQVSDITKVVAPDTFERLIYAGNAVQTVRSKDKVKVITVSHRDIPGSGALAVRRRSRMRRCRRIPVSHHSLAKSFRSRTGRSWPRPKSSCRVAAPCKAATKLHQIHRAGCRQAWCCHWSLPCRCRCRLCAE